MLLYNSGSVFVPTGSVLYDLYAICNHAGTVNMGHYTACCLDENGWCFYNDSRWDIISFYTQYIHILTTVHQRWSIYLRNPAYSVLRYVCINVKLFPSSAHWQCDSTHREPASDQSSLCAVLPAQQQHRHRQEIDWLPSSQSEQLYLQCP